MVTSADIVNQAINAFGDNQTPVTGTYPTFDSSSAGVAAALLYGPTVQATARQFGWDFERNTVALVTSGNVAPFPWTYEYLYPTNGIEVWQVMPTSATDPNNPVPVNWVVANAVVAGAPAKVIHCNLTPAQAVYANQPGEALWDPLFTEAVVRLLTSKMAMALAGRPDTSREALEQAAQFGQLAALRDS